MSLWFHQLCPYYVPIRSPSFTQLCYFPNYFPSISHRVSQIYMWIYVDSHDMPILSVRAYIIPINWWLQRDSHGSQGFFRQVRWVLLLGPRQAGRVQENRTAEVSDDRCWCFMKWQNMEHASKIWLNKWGNFYLSKRLKWMDHFETNSHLWGAEIWAGQIFRWRCEEIGMF